MKESTLFMHSPLCQLQLVCTVQRIHSFKISLMVQPRAVQLGLINLATIEIITGKFREFVNSLKQSRGFANSLITQIYCNIYML